MIFYKFLNFFIQRTILLLKTICSLPDKQVLRVYLSVLERAHRIFRLSFLASRQETILLFFHFSWKNQFGFKLITINIYIEFSS